MPRTLGCVFPVRRVAKKKYQRAADAAVTYGIGIVGPIDHATRFGLFLNVERAELRHAARVVSGVGLSCSELPLYFFQAITDSIEEANVAKAICDSQSASTPGFE